jgi:hypothetical protein
MLRYPHKSALLFLRNLYRMLMLQFGRQEMGWWGEGVEGNGVGPNYEVKECFIHHPLLFLNRVMNPDSDQDLVGTVLLLSNTGLYLKPAYPDLRVKN